MQIFISYARQDRSKAEPLANALRAHGWTVWWDRLIRTGVSFERTIERELEQAACVVVLWSQAALDSDWVRAEANYAKGEDKYFPILVESGIEPPLQYRHIQTASLVDWRGDLQSPSLSHLRGDLGKLCGKPQNPSLIASPFVSIKPGAQDKTPPSSKSTKEYFKPSRPEAQFEAPLYSSYFKVNLGEAESSPTASKASDKSEGREVLRKEPSPPLVNQAEGEFPWERHPGLRNYLLSPGKIQDWPDSPSAETFSWQEVLDRHRAGAQAKEEPSLDHPSQDTLEKLRKLLNESKDLSSRPETPDYKFQDILKIPSPFGAALEDSKTSDWSFLTPEQETPLYVKTQTKDDTFQKLLEKYAASLKKEEDKS